MLDAEATGKIGDDVIPEYPLRVREHRDERQRRPQRDDLRERTQEHEPEKHPELRAAPRRQMAPELNEQRNDIQVGSHVRDACDCALQRAEAPARNREKKLTTRASNSPRIPPTANPLPTRRPRRGQIRCSGTAAGSTTVKAYSLRVFASM